MRFLFKYILPTLALGALVSCSEDSADPAVVPYCGKELIAFSQEGSAMTRAAMTRTGFTSNTKIVMRIKAEEKNGSGVRYTQTNALAGPEETSCEDHGGYGMTTPHSHVSYPTEDDKRYWDDAFGRVSQLTVYAVAVPDQNVDATLSSTILDQTVGTSVGEGWYTISGAENTKITWDVTTTQSETTHSTKDLAYSNNIRNGESTYKGCYRQTYSGSAWTKSMELGCMIWQPMTNSPTETIGMFDMGHLVFKHALSWITIIIKEKENTSTVNGGFDNTSNKDFKWTNNHNTVTQNITLKGFPTSGQLDVSTGEWSNTTTPDITQLYEEIKQGETDANRTIRTLHAYVLPGTILYNNNDNVIEFEIDEGQYYVTGKQIADAIRANGTNTSFTATEAGKHYTINLTVSKKGLDDITAAIIPWEDVNSTDADAKKALTEFTFEDRGDKLGAADAAKFNIYRTLTNTTDYNWTTGYGTAATKTWATDHWTTNWYWENDQSFYHFRAAGPSVSITTDAEHGDNFSISSGTYDYLWGAPFVDVADTYKFKYDDTNGFAQNGETKQISTAIGATNSTINMLLFHVMSKINVNVQTTTDAGKVLLEDAANTDEGKRYTKVEILNFLPNGKVLMGTGAVSITSTERTSSVSMTKGTYTAESETTPAKVTFSYYMTPQALSWTSGTIGLRITTPDGNIYTVEDLGKCYATVTSTNLLNPYTNPNSSGKYKIDTWFPCYQYKYTVILTKTGILNITATLLDWETVSADEETIQIK